MPFIRIFIPGTNPCDALTNRDGDRDENFALVDRIVGVLVLVIVPHLDFENEHEDDEHDVPGYQRPEPAGPLCAAKRGFLFWFSQLTPPIMEPSQGSHALPSCS